MSYFAELGKAAGSQAVGGIFALGAQRLGAGYDRKQQLKTQEKMMGIQMMGEKAMTDYNMQKQLEMWEKTGPQGQMEQLEKAGLNPGMIYGMSGAGGGTTNVATGSVGSGTAQYQDTIGMAIQAGLQMEMQRAQIANIEADTKQKNATTTKTGWETKLLTLQEELKKYTLGNEKSMSDQELSKLRTEVQMLWNERDIQEAGMDAEKQMKLAELTVLQADAELKKAGKELNDKQKAKLTEEINLLQKETDWREREVKVKELVGDWQAGMGPQAGSIIGDILNFIQNALTPKRRRP